MKKATKNEIRIILTLIFVLIPVLRPGKPVQAASGQGNILAQAAFEEATDEWNVMVERLDTAIRNGKGENVNYSAGNSFTVPVDILEKLAGRNATLALQTSNGITFSVSGRDVRDTDTPISMTVCFDPVVSEKAFEQLEGYEVVKQFYMVDKENYPCYVNVHMALGEENVGKHAVLYSYDEDKDCLRQETNYRITKDGHAIFGLNRGDEYVVIIMKGYRVAEGDTFSHIALKNGVSLQELQAVNPQIADIDKIGIGELINIPNR